MFSVFSKKQKIAWIEFGQTSKLTDLLRLGLQTGFNKDLATSKFNPKGSVLNPRGYFHIRRSGGLGLHINFGGKIWGKVQPSSPNKRKNLGSSVTTRCKSWGKFPILGSYLKFRGQNLEYLSPIFLEAKFGAPTRISEANFGAKPPHPPPRPPNMEVPTGVELPKVMLLQVISPCLLLGDRMEIIDTDFSIKLDHRVTRVNMDFVNIY